MLLVAFGGLMAAIDAALSVTSRADLEEMGSAGRNAASLARIAADPEPHANAVAFMRVFVETAAAVLVTVAFVLLLNGQIWWAMLTAVVIMTGTTFVLVGASPRSFGRLHAAALLRVCAPDGARGAGDPRPARAGARGVRQPGHARRRAGAPSPRRSSC